MASDKRLRQQAILRVIAREPVATQRQLAAALRRAGFDATQATISRDILELGLVKVRDASGTKHHYSAPRPEDGSIGPERLRRFCQDYAVDGAVASTLVVLRSAPGTAPALAAAIDGCGLGGVIGTLAGDDTVFLATSNQIGSRLVLRRLLDYGVIERSER